MRLRSFKPTCGVDPGKSRIGRYLRKAVQAGLVLALGSIAAPAQAQGVALENWSIDLAAADPANFVGQVEGIDSLTFTGLFHKVTAADGSGAIEFVVRATEFQADGLSLRRSNATPPEVLSVHFEVTARGLVPNQANPSPPFPPNSFTNVPPGTMTLWLDAAVDSNTSVNGTGGGGFDNGVALATFALAPGDGGSFNPDSGDGSSDANWILEENLCSCLKDETGALLAPGTTLALTDANTDASPGLITPLSMTVAPGTFQTGACGGNINDFCGTEDGSMSLLTLVQTPEIQLLKEVSVDGGVTFFDANDSASAPATALGGGALYRLTVTNTGATDLENVVVNDPTLGIMNFAVGNLAAGQTVVLTSGEIPQLDQPGRCQVPGDVTNIATVDGQSVTTGAVVSDSDPAVVRCAEEAIEILKEVSIDGGVTFFDANDAASAPVATLGGGALYRLTVTNTGSSDLQNVVVNDASLGVVNFVVGNLAAGQTVVLTSGEIPQLEQPGRCQAPGDVTNIASVDGQSVDTGNTVSDSDPAVVRCVEEAIRLIKEVSVDGGATFFDANDSASAPATGLGGGALYRLTVTNTGTSDLENVVINDATLGIMNFLVGDLAIGQTVVLTSGEIPQLDQPNRCLTPGDVTNIASVDGQSVDTGNTVMDSDPAVVRCAEEAIEILKEVSVDGGVTFFDANDSASAPSTTVGGGALYRLTVTNTGTSDLENVVINDATLGIVDFLVGDLAAGQSVVLTSGEIPQLDQPGRCQTPGDVTNVASVTGQSVDTGNTVSDSDPAVVTCRPPAGGEGCTPGYWKQRHHFDSWSVFVPGDSFDAVFGVASSFDGTLLEALRRGGGGEKALGRHATAALLNSSNAGVSFAFSSAEVISIVQDAYLSGNFEDAKNSLAGENERGCPLN